MVGYANLNCFASIISITSLELITTKSLNYRHYIFLGYKTDTSLPTIISLAGEDCYIPYFWWTLLLLYYLLWY